jgi:hypothetical protein
MWEIVSFASEVWKDHKEWLVGVPGILACVWQALPEAVRKWPQAFIVLLWYCLSLPFKRSAVKLPLHLQTCYDNLCNKSELDGDDSLVFKFTKYQLGNVTVNDQGKYRYLPLTWAEQRLFKAAFKVRLRNRLKDREEKMLEAAALGQKIDVPPPPKGPGSAGLV